MTFVLPAYAPRPSGGFKVAYEYATRLQARGHAVSVVHPRSFLRPGNLPQKVWSRLWPSAMRILVHPLVPWFPMRPPVKLLLVEDLHPRFIPNADVIVATGWQTAEMIANYPASKGRKFYLLFDYEYWMTADQETRKRMSLTYHAGLSLIATSPSVREMLSANGASASANVDCGIDFDIYGVDVPVAARRWGTVGFPVRREPFKGTADALDGLRQIRERHGSKVEITAFGSVPRPDLPSWVRYVRSPSDLQLRAFYNSISIFVFPSHYEGLGLPGMEAMACGTALVSADAVGNRDYAFDGETALIIPRQRPDLLADSITRLLDDDTLRQSLAQRGLEHVQRYTWCRAVDAMETLLSPGAVPADSAASRPFRKHGATGFGRDSI